MKYDCYLFGLVNKETFVMSRLMKVSESNFTHKNKYMSILLAYESGKTYEQAEKKLKKTVKKYLKWITKHPDWKNL